MPIMFAKLVPSGMSFRLEKGESPAICGANGAGKSTLPRLLPGVEPASFGVAIRTISTSWPLNYSSTFRSSLTGSDNARLIARIYDRDEVTAKGDERFRAWQQPTPMDRRSRASLMMTSRDTHTLLTYKTRGAVVCGSSLVVYDTIGETVEVHRRLRARMS